MTTPASPMQKSVTTAMPSLRSGCWNEPPPDLKPAASSWSGCCRTTARPTGRPCGVTPAPVSTSHRSGPVCIGRRPTGRSNGSTALLPMAGPAPAVTNQRSKAVKPWRRWLHHYNHHRPNTVCGTLTPFTRLTNVPGQHTFHPTRNSPAARSEAELNRCSRSLSSTRSGSSPPATVRSMRTALRAFTASIVVGLLMGLTPAAQAAGWVNITEGTWYKSYFTCMSRGQALIETGQYKGPRVCNRNAYTHPDGTYRWTLRLNVWTNGSGGGGFGSWSIPAESEPS